RHAPARSCAESCARSQRATTTSWVTCPHSPIQVWWKRWCESTSASGAPGSAGCWADAPAAPNHGRAQVEIGTDVIETGVRIETVDEHAVSGLPMGPTQSVLSSHSAVQFWVVVAHWLPFPFSTGSQVRPLLH